MHRTCRRGKAQAHIAQSTSAWAVAVSATSSAPSGANRTSVVRGTGRVYAFTNNKYPIACVPIGRK